MKTLIRDVTLDDISSDGSGDAADVNLFKRAAEALAERDRLSEADAIARLFGNGDWVARAHRLAGEDGLRRDPGTVWSDRHFVLRHVVGKWYVEGLQDGAFSKTFEVVKSREAGYRLVLAKYAEYAEYLNTIVTRLTDERRAARSG